MTTGCTARGLALSAVFVAIFAGAPRAQTPVKTETQLLAETAQAPQRISAYLELTRLYVEQQRFDEAERMLTRARGVLETLRLSAASGAPLAAATVSGGVSPVIGGPPAPPRPPSAPLRVGANVRPPVKIRNVDPVYPAEAQALGVQGVVFLEAIIGTDGSVTSLRVLNSRTPVLNQAAIDAVKQWKYEPTQVNGVPVSIIMTVTVNFKLG